MISDFELLNQPRFRQEKEAAANIFVAEGFKILERSLNLGYIPRALLTTEKWLPRLQHLDLSQFQIFVRSESEVETLVGFNVHRGLLATFEPKPYPDISQILSTESPIVFLENLVDLENVGTIFRTAAAFNVAGILLGPNTPDPYYRRVIKSSMGAVLSIPHLRLSDISELMQLPGNRRLVGMSLAAKQELQDYVPSGTEIVVFGSEGNGISNELRSMLDVELIIPIAENIDSLNVAAAASITLWHFSQRV